MNTSQILQVFYNLGLSQNSAKVYLEAVKLGSSKAAQLSKNSGVKRTTVYLAVKDLVERGLMSVQYQGFKKIYVAENPSKLESILEQNKTELMRTLPFLDELFHEQSEDVHIQYFEGQSNIRREYRQVLRQVKAGEDYLVVTDQENWLNSDPKFFTDFIAERAKLNLKLKLLFTYSEIAQKHKRSEKIFAGEIKILPKDLQFQTNIVITKQTVLIHEISKNPRLLVLKHQGLIKTLEQLFLLIWKML